MYKFLLLANFLCITLMTGCCVSQDSEQPFYAEPTNQSLAFEYNSTNQITITLLCTAENIRQSNHTVVWYKNGILISNEANALQVEGLTDNRYSVINSTSGQQFTANLHIEADAFHVEFDSGQYFCAVVTTPEYSIIVQSNVANILNYVNPQCLIGFHGPNNFNVIEGEMVLLTCDVDKATEQRDSLQFVKVGEETRPLVPTTTGVTGDTNRGFIQYSWLATKSESPIKFTCTWFDQSLSLHKSCQLGPFNVQYKPSIQIMSSSQTVSEENTLITFTCDTEANPAVEKYEWTLPDIPRFTLESGNIQLSNENKSLSMTGFLMEDNDEYTVTCSATNSIGTSTASITLYVNISIPVLPSTVNMQTDNKEEQTLFTQRFQTKEASEMYTSNISTKSTASGEGMSKDVPLIIGSAAGAFGFIVVIIVVSIVVVCVLKSRRKSQKNETPDEFISKENDCYESCDNNTGEISRYSSSSNAAYGNVNDVDQAVSSNEYDSVEITLHAKLALKKTGKTTAIHNGKARPHDNTTMGDVPNDLPGIELKDCTKPAIAKKPNVCKTTANKMTTSTDGRLSSTSTHEERSSKNYAETPDTISEMYTEVDMSKKKRKTDKRTSTNCNADETTDMSEQHTEIDADIDNKVEKNSRMNNVEGLTYAELDLSSTKSNMKNKKRSMTIDNNEESTYAEVRI